MTTHAGEHDVDVMHARKLLEGARTIARLAEELTALLDRPVVDRDAVRQSASALRDEIERASSAMRRPRQ